MCEFQHSSSSVSCTFGCKIRESKTEVPSNKKAEQANLPTDSCLHNSTFPNLVNRVSKRSPWLVNKHSMVPKKTSALSVILARHGASKSCSPSRTTNQFALVSIALLLALALFLAVMIRPSWKVSQSWPPVLGFTHFVQQSRCSRSTLTTVCFSYCFCVYRGSLCTYRGLCVHRSVHVSGLQTWHQIHHRLVVECGVHGLRIPISQFAVLKQRLAVLQHKYPLLMS